jgi:hypothetical protein
MVYANTSEWTLNPKKPTMCIQPAAQPLPCYLSSQALPNKVLYNVHRHHECVLAGRAAALWRPDHALAWV